MAAAIIIPPPTTDIPDASAARKRRREKLSSHRQVVEDSTPATNNFLLVPSSFASFADEEGYPIKFRRVSNCSEPDKPDVQMSASSTKKKPSTTKKKPQMKYDPDVPMNKEEAALWRREQRRKRNRESAALSRQRQRDRIGDLEIEVDSWKTKVELIMERIKKLEEKSGFDSSKLIPGTFSDYEQEDVVHQSLEFEVIDNNNNIKESMFVSPPASPGHSSFLPEASPIASSDAKTVVDAVVDQVLMGIESYEQEFSDNMISRQATS